MNKYINIKSPQVLLAVLLIAFWLVNVLTAAFLELANDEAYYWMYAQHPAWGYFDHPPMTMALIWLGTHVFGGELGVRFFSTILQPIYLYLFYLIIRRKDDTRTDVLLYFLITSALPILQLYGLVAVPDAPLLFFTVLFWYFYKQFTETESSFSTLMMGVSMAGLAYSKYHGALVVGFTFLSNLRLFRNRRFYVSLLTALVLFLPHLLWQYRHDFVSFHYHLVDRNKHFKWVYPCAYLLNLLLVYNPLFVWMYIKFVLSKPVAENLVERAVKVTSIGIVLFFACSTLRGYAQPQWTIPLSFGCIWILYKRERESEALCKYIKWVGGVFLGLMLLIRLVAVFNPLHIQFEVFENKTSYNQIKHVAGDRPVMIGNYARAAKYRFYTGGEAFSQAGFPGRNSQWMFWDYDHQAKGKEVIFECKNEKRATHKIALKNGEDFNYRRVFNFLPMRNVKVETAVMPTEVCIGDSVYMTVDFVNPYNYAIPMATAEVGLEWLLYTTDTTFAIVDTSSRLMLAPESRGRAGVAFEVPSTVDVGDYQAVFRLRNDTSNVWRLSESKYVTVKPAVVNK